MDDKINPKPSIDFALLRCHSIFEPEFSHIFVRFMENEEWNLLFDGSKCIHGGGVGIILINPHSDAILMSYFLNFDCTNNMAEYEALISSMKATILMKVKMIKIFGDSQQIIKQVFNIYNNKDPKLQPYKKMVENLLIYFNEYEIDNIPRDSNTYVDIMASATSLAPINIEYEETILITKIIGKSSHEFVVEDFIKDHCYSATSINVCEWYQDVFNYLKDVVISITFEC